MKLYLGAYRQASLNLSHTNSLFVFIIVMDDATN